MIIEHGCIGEDSETLNIYKQTLEETHNFLIVEAKKPEFFKMRQQFWRLILSIYHPIINKLGFVIVNKKMFVEIHHYFYNLDRIKWSPSLFLTILKRYRELDNVRESLADKDSKEIFDWRLKLEIASTVIGRMAVNLYPTTMINKLPNNQMGGGDKVVKKKRNLYEVKNYTIECLHIINETWTDEQYLLKDKCEPKLGDVVISAGALCGETSIWFADKVGKTGKVYAFEPYDKFAKITQNNVRRNNLEQTIEVINAGLWEEDTEIFFTPVNSNLAGSFISADKGKLKVPVVTLDTFVETENIKHVDFIKMDVEGAELSALKGAINTLIKFKPKLAISVYHYPNDIADIPLFIKSLVPEYKFYMSHKHEWVIETILFATIGD